MKKCPYCAEEILEEAVYCKHCHMKVKGVWTRRIIKILIVLAAAGFIAFHWDSVTGIWGKLQLVIKDMDDAWNSIMNLIKSVQTGAESLQEYNSRIEMINSIQ